MAELTNTKKQEFAKLLYLQGSVTQKQISERVGVTEKTVSNWIKKFNWEKLKASMTITKEEELGRLYRQLSNLNSHIEARENKWPSTTEADTISKIGSAIRKLETEVSISETIEVSKRFIQWLQKNFPEKAKEYVLLIDEYLKEIIK